MSVFYSENLSYSNSGPKREVMSSNNILNNFDYAHIKIITGKK